MMLLASDAEPSSALVGSALAECDGGSDGEKLPECILAALQVGQHSQAVLFDAVDGEQALAAKALLETLAAICKADPTAECLLLCERRHLHSASFGGVVRHESWIGCEEPGSEPADVWRRIHIKYVQPPSATGDGRSPQLIEVLAGLQNLSFSPAAIAVFGLVELVRLGPGSVAGPAGGEAASAASAHGPAAGGGAGAGGSFAFGLRGSLDFQLLALTSSLLVDAAAHAACATSAAAAAGPDGPQGRSRRRCAALVWEASANVSAHLGLLGSVFDAVWLAESHDHRGDGSVVCTANKLF